MHGVTLDILDEKQRKLHFNIGNDSPGLADVHLPILKSRGNNGAVALS